MAYTALYREWRPRTFNDVVGQEHITTTLKNQILNNRIAHAYLFCGTRGTGKTSTAKVFAKALNCLNLKDGEPCNECEMCKKINEGLAIDVTELDAASNNGVDKIRDIIDDVKYPPQEAKYKVYIMDEVHMLSAGAVNAFLKTLEEPPNNVIFILIRRGLYGKTGNVFNGNNAYGRGQREKKEKIGIRETRACFLFNTCIFGICGFCVLSIY